MNKYFLDIKDAIWTILIGMGVTLKHMFMRKVTIQYPDEKHVLPERIRNRLYVNMDDCIGCDQCAKACPVNCITIETIKALPGEDIGATSTGNKKRLWIPVFDIDTAKCCFCGLCVFPCPTECIEMTAVFEYSEYNRDDLIYHFSTMTSEEIIEKKQAYEKYQQEQEIKKTAAEAKKKDIAENPRNHAVSAPDSSGQKSVQSSDEGNINRTP